MTVLQGTMSDGTLIPVQADSQGRLVCEGLQGPQGPQGPPGVGELPPNPKNGDVLAWDNGLVWVSGVIPVGPPWVSDEITAVNTNSAFASYSKTGDGGNDDSSGSFDNLFDGALGTKIEFYSTSATAVHTITLSQSYTGQVIIYNSNYGLPFGSSTIQVGSSTLTPNSVNSGVVEQLDFGVQTFDKIVITNTLTSGGGHGVALEAISVGGEFLLNNATMLTFKTDKDLANFAAGDAINQEDSAASGTVGFVDAAAKTMTLAASTGTWGPANAGHYVISAADPVLYGNQFTPHR